MRDLILIPTVDRAEFLALCLEHIRSADGDKKEIWIAQDRAEHRSFIASETQQVASRFGARLIRRPKHRYVGNAFNCLELYKEAWQQPDIRFVYFIEDDVLVAKDFFAWHEAIQERGDYFCSVGWHCIRNAAAVKSDDPHAYIESAGDFSSIGVCWRREKLSAIAEHATPEYYSRPVAYLQKNFGLKPIPPGKWTEQAGLVLRVLLNNPSAVVAWPARPRCAHVGITGYHRPRGFRFAGNLDQRTEQLRQAVQSTETLLGLSKERFDDIESLPSFEPWTASELKVVQRFDDKAA